MTTNTTPDAHLMLNDRLEAAYTELEDAAAAVGQAYRAAADLAADMGGDEDVFALMRQLLEVANGVTAARNNLPDFV